MAANRETTMTRTRTSIPTILALTASGMPNLRTESQDTPFITLTKLDLSPTANTRIGVDETGRVIAIVTTDDGEITEIGLATLDAGDQLVFGPAEMIKDGGNLLLQMVQTGGVLMNDGRALTIDPLNVAWEMFDAGFGHDYVNIVAMIEGSGDNAQLILGRADTIGGGTAVNAKMLSVADLTFFELTSHSNNSGTVVRVRKSGTTWVANDNNMSPIDLATIVTSHAQPVPAGATTRHGPRGQATVAA